MPKPGNNSKDQMSAVAADKGQIVLKESEIRLTCSPPIIQV